ncbi:hypothetical protein PTUN_a4191 [Pseudoalteromonas tunicata]|nr:hypothetical protein PTUN_a4191 [Pseudoalteromonas tunicata]
MIKATNTWHKVTQFYLTQFSIICFPTYLVKGIFFISS